MIKDKIKVKAKWVEGFRLTVNNGRGHEIMCDQPVIQGGDNAGPTALELAVMALAGCAVTIFVDVCKQSEIELHQFEVGVECQKHSQSSGLKSVNLKATVSAKARKKLLEAAWRRTEANCPVLLVYQQPIPVNVEFRVASE